MTTSLSQFTGYGGYYNAVIVQNTPPEAAFYREFYQLLKAYYGNNGLYEFINDVLQSTRISNKDVKPLRNPANRVIEFYAAKLWPGHDLSIALPIVTDNERMIEPINQIWQWSNFAIKKQEAARTFANLGDMFIKISTRNDGEGEATAVYQQFLDPTYVSEFKTDERGFLTYIRMDIPEYERNERGELVENVHTEVWDKDTRQYAIWKHKQGLDIELSKINTEPMTGDFVKDTDFIPIVYQSFRSDGDGRCSGAYVHAMDKIDEINVKATRLAQLLFRYGKADKTLTSEATDKSGRPLPPPNVDALTDSNDMITIQGEKFWRLPSGWKIDHMIANMDYESHLKAIDADIIELQQDLPELLYSKISESDNLSGRALRYMLEAAISRLLEARGNGEAAFVRANQMALTIGQNIGLFKEIGKYEDGSLNHSFAPRPVLSPDKLEIAQVAEQWVTAGASLEQAAVEAGVTRERANELAQVQAFGSDEVPR